MLDSYRELRNHVLNGRYCGLPPIPIFKDNTQCMLDSYRELRNHVLG
jgi:hypothetical protein